jgi:hypothetical protein
MLQDVTKTALLVGKIAIRTDKATMAKNMTVTLLLQPSQGIFLHLLYFFLVRFTHVV